nr:immunoglobulin light chain junction region [Macaca mulatta]MOX18781.1 immunoglobulin light chain junction region [Macaca mulatta]MOX20144.1 immunoglobulin light chain junction region [Macaca mulatta]MOX20329.1 immunoglobulin light chain junction region [Macaca mulatta]MOX23087.1 immunoglobulin light chain junction region [Macaca mulatta]
DYHCAAWDDSLRTVLF